MNIYTRAKCYNVSSFEMYGISFSKKKKKKKKINVWYKRKKLEHYNVKSIKMFYGKSFPKVNRKQQNIT